MSTPQRRSAPTPVAPEAAGSRRRGLLKVLLGTAGAVTVLSAAPAAAESDDVIDGGRP